jgi:hypothetical protein
VLVIDSLRYLLLAIFVAATDALLLCCRLEFFLIFFFPDVFMLRKFVESSSLPPQAHEFFGRVVFLSKCLWLEALCVVVVG